MTAPQTVAEVLDAAADLLTPEGAWTQGDFARTAAGDSLENGWDDGAVCFCIMGAIEHVVGPDETTRPFRAAVLEVTEQSVTAYNDTVGRTQADVVAKLREAAALARGEKAHV